MCDENTEIGYLYQIMLKIAVRLIHESLPGRGDEKMDRPRACTSSPDEG